MAEVKKHKQQRAFYDMSGADNIYKYITTEGKMLGEEAQKFTMLEYLQKSTGVFNQDGMLSKEEVKAMRKRAQTGEKNIWHGFISFNKENSNKIDSLEKCIALVRQTFDTFFKDAGFDPSNMDLMCALHLDRPEHLHIHYVFWEKEPTIKNPRAAGYIYRKKGKIPLDVITKMTERLNAYTVDDELVRKRQEALWVLRHKSSEYLHAHIMDNISADMRALANKIPKNASFFYAKKDMAPYRKDVDGIVESITFLDDDFYNADKAFRQEVQNKGDEFQIVKWEYECKLGNIILRKVREIQQNTYKVSARIKHKTNDKRLKRSLAISRRKVNGILGELFSSVTDLFTTEAHSFSNRINEIEEEMKAEQEKSQQFTTQPSKRWSWGKD